VYFHWPHEDGKAGKASEHLCTKVLNDESVARWALLFRCVQVDMAKSDASLVKLLEAGDQPQFFVIPTSADEDAHVIARIAAPPTSMKMAQALEDAIGRVPDAAKRLKSDLAEQDRLLAEGKAALKAGKPKDALAAYDRVRMSTVRVGPQFERAIDWGYDVEQRIARDGAK
jgi:hypothetical protein